MQKFSLHYHSFVLITPLYHPVRRRRPLCWARLAITRELLTTILDLMSRWGPRAPSANSLVWLSIIFTKDVAGARLALPRMTFSANKWPVRLFPGSSIIQLLWGETRLDTGNTILQSPGQLNNNLSSQRIFNQARKMNRKKYKLETPSLQ